MYMNIPGIILCRAVTLDSIVSYADVVASLTFICKTDALML
jgi:hypothetical protein